MLSRYAVSVALLKGPDSAVKAATPLEHFCEHFLQLLLRCLSIHAETQVDPLMRRLQRAMLLLQGTATTGINRE